MRRNKKRDRQRIKQSKISYNEGLKIFSPYGKLIYTLKPGFSLDYNELLRKNRQKYQVMGGTKGTKISELNLTPLKTQI